MRCAYVVAGLAVLIGPGEQKKSRVLEVGDEVKVHLIGDEARLNQGVERAGIARGTIITLLATEGTRATREIDLDNFKAFKAAIDAGDADGVAELITMGKAFRVRDGTRCLVLKRGFDLPALNARPLLEMPTTPAGVARVRILDGPAKGLAGWIPVRNLID
jgi:hypothetical protein